MGLGPTRDHALEHVGEPGQGLDPVELRGRHQTCHDRPVVGSAIRAREQAILAPQGNRPDRSLDDVRVQLEPAVLKERNRRLRSTLLGDCRGRILR
jgi:hypothetical protein